MGLPMFREPDEPASQVTAKVERHTATARSAIRREPTLRPTRYNLLVAAQNEHSRSTRHRRASSSRIWWGSQDENGIDEYDRRQAGEELLRDALQHGSGHRLRLPRPPRESALRFEIAPSPPASNSRSLSPWRSRSIRRHHMPSPPYSLSSSRPNQSSQVDGPLRSFTSHRAELTPGFPPAQGVHLENIETPHDAGRPLPDDGFDDSTPPLVPVGTPPRDSWEADYPPLRRFGNLSHDGLGDRRRSPSIASSEGRAEEDTWETLLTTMEPDEHLPSAESSFTSASASASTSRRSESASNSARSFPTTTTSLSPDDGITGPLPCDLDDINGTNDELLSEESRQMMVAMREGVRVQRQRRSARLDPETERRSRSLEDQRLFQSYHSLRLADLRERSELIDQRQRQVDVALAENGIATGIIDAALSDAGAELTTMQRFIERMARRQDIPDDWWAAAGLSRTLRDNES